MEEIRKKQKMLKRIMNIAVIITAVFLFVFIGIQPSVAKSLGTTFSITLHYVCDLLVIASLILVLVYYSKYSKAEMFFNDVEGEINDCGYYFTAREERDIVSYFNAVCNDLAASGFYVDNNVEINELTFDARALKKKEFIYIINEDKLDKNDVIAYLDSAIYDITAVNVKRKGSTVVLFICNTADEDAVSLSKAVTSFGRKNQLKFTIAIAEMTSARVYFPGCNPTKCQQLTANYVMNCDLPIKDEFKGKEKLPFQYELKEHMKAFNLKDFRNGTFSAH